MKKITILLMKMPKSKKIIASIVAMSALLSVGAFALNGYFGGGDKIPEDTMTRGLVASWDFDEGSGQVAYDATTNNNHGNFPHTGPGLKFDGDNDYVNCGNHNDLNITAAITISAWVKLNSDYSSIQAIVGDISAGGGENNFGLEFGRTNNEFGWIHGGAIIATSSVGLSDNNWHHIVATKEGSAGNWDISFYLDGVFDETDNSAVNPGINPGNTTIGAYGDHNSDYFNGAIDEVRIYSRALGAAEVNEHYHGIFSDNTGRVGYWPFDEGEGDVVDNSGSCGASCDGDLDGYTTAQQVAGYGDTNNTGWTTLAASLSDSAPSWTQGESGAGLEFDGENDYVDCGNDPSLDITDAITVEAWVKESVRKSIAKIVIRRATSYPFYFLGVDSGSPYASVSDGSGYTSVTADSTMSLNEWHHLVMSFNDTTDEIILYVDGVSKTVTTARTYPGDTAKLQIGKAEMAGDSAYFNGSIDGVKIYNRALSAEEVRYHYNRGGPVAHWKFDEGSGESAQDSSGNNNDGTLKSSALDFDGINDYVDVDSHISNFASLTEGSIAGWFRCEATADHKTILSATDKSDTSSDLSIMIHGNGEIAYYIREGGDQLAFNYGDFEDSSWHYFVITINSSGNKLYIDGLQVTPAYSTGSSSTQKFFSDVNDLDTLRIGNREDSGGNEYPFNGAIDEVRIYNKALHADTIANHYKGDYSTDEKTAGSVALTADDLVLYIPFDDEAGDAATNYGTCGGTPSNCDGDLTNYSAAEEVAKYGDSHTTGWVIDTDWTTARQNTGLEFGGVNGFFQSDDYIASASAFSHSLWFRNDNLSIINDQYIFSQGDDDPSAYIESAGDDAGKIKVMADNALKITSIATVLDTQWHHIEITADGTNLKLYLDGVLDGRAAWAGSSDDAGISAGAHISRSGFFDGTIDDFKVYSYARSADEIRLDYNAGYAVRFGGLTSHSSGGQTSTLCARDPASCMDYGLVGHWNMDEAGGDTLYDQSDNGNDGTLGSGAGADTSDPKWVSVTLGGVSDTHGSGTALQFDGENDYVNCYDEKTQVLTRNQKTLTESRSFSAVGSGVEPRAGKDAERVSVVAPAVGEYLPASYRNDIVPKDKKNNNPFDKVVIFDVLSGHVVPTTDTQYHYTNPNNLVNPHTYWGLTSSNLSAKGALSPISVGVNPSAVEKWKHFKDLGSDDEILTLNPDTGLSEWHKPYRYIEYPYEGEMFHFFSHVDVGHQHSVDLLVTPDHQMYASILGCHSEGANRSEQPKNLVEGSRGNSAGSFATAQDDDWGVQDDKRCAQDDGWSDFKLISASELRRKRFRAQTGDGEIIELHQEIVDYNGMVYDVTVDNHILLVRRASDNLSVINNSCAKPRLAQHYENGSRSVEANQKIAENSAISGARNLNSGLFVSRFINRERVGNKKQSNKYAQYAASDIKQCHCLNNFHNYLEKNIAEHRNEIASINPIRVLEEIKEIAPSEKIGLISALRKNALAISLQKLDTTFNWFEDNNISINCNDSKLEEGVKERGIGEIRGIGGERRAERAASSPLSLRGSRSDRSNLINSEEAGDCFVAPVATGAPRNDSAFVIARERGASVANYRYPIPVQVSHCEPAGEAIPVGVNDEEIASLGLRPSLAMTIPVWSGNCGNDSSLDITDAITIEAWVKISTSRIWDGIVCKWITGDRSYMIALDGNKKFSFLLSADGTTFADVVSNSVPIINEWYHLVGVRRGNTMYFYVNSVQQTDTDTFTGSIYTSTTFLEIGAYEEGGECFNGSIDGVKIYNRALGAEEVRYHYNRGGPVAHWKFDEGSGQYARDSVGTADAQLGVNASSSGDPNDPAWSR